MNSTLIYLNLSPTQKFIIKFIPKSISNKHNNTSPSTNHHELNPLQHILCFQPILNQN